MGKLPTTDTTEMEAILSVKVPTETTQIKKKNGVLSWFKKTFASSTETEHSHISRQNAIEGAVWTTSSTKYHPSGYYTLKTGSEISFYGPFANPSLPVPRPKSSHAYGKPPEDTAPASKARSEPPHTPTRTNPDAFTGSFVHFRKDPTPIPFPAFSHSSPRAPALSTPTRPPRNSGQRPPNMTHFDYLSSINHTFPENTYRAYTRNHVCPSPPPRPRAPHHTAFVNRNKDLPEIPYRTSKTRFPFTETGSSHAYHDHIAYAGANSASRTREAVRERNRADALARLCDEQGEMPVSPVSFTSTSEDWERDWDVPLSQRAGALQGRGIQIRNRESFVVSKRESGGEEVVRRGWKREGRRVGFVDVEGARWVDGRQEMVEVEEVGKEGEEIEVAADEEVVGEIGAKSQDMEVVEQVSVKKTVRWV